MDWQGQKLSEQMMQIFLLGSALVAFLMGFFLSSCRVMLITYVAGVSITFLLTVPEWPFFNRHPLEWSEPPTGAPRSKLLRSRQQESAKKSTKTAAKR